MTANPTTEAPVSAEGTVDPRTGRLLGDHGLPTQAIEFALDWKLCDDPQTFLSSWREGALDEWPEFYIWLAQQPTPSQHPEAEKMAGVVEAACQAAEQWLEDEIGYSAEICSRSVSDAIRAALSTIPVAPADESSITDADIDEAIRHGFGDRFASPAGEPNA